MNVTFHTITGLATAVVLSSRQKITDSPRLFTASDMPLLAAGFVAGVLTHGLLDYIPHSYPIAPVVDVPFSLAMFVSMLLFVSRRYWLLLGACFLGCIFPDLVDLGPLIVNRIFGWSLPVVSIFPWHWGAYSGSIFDGSRDLESLLYHLLVIGADFGLLYVYRRRSFRLKGRAHLDIFTL